MFFPDSLHEFGVSSTDEQKKRGSEAMDRVEKAIELLQRAAKLGLRPEFRDGLNILNVIGAADPELTEALTRYLPEIRSILQRRAVAALASKHVGSRIFSKEHGPGTLIEASEDGTLSISVNQERRQSHEDEIRFSQISITANADSLVLILDEAEASDPADQKPESELPRKKLFGLI
jgi:hypothetical protein